MSAMTAFRAFTDVHGKPIPRAIQATATTSVEPKPPTEVPPTMKIDRAKLARRIGLPADASESLIRARLAGVEIERQVRADRASLASSNGGAKQTVPVSGEPLSITRSVGGNVKHIPGGLGVNVDAEESLIGHRLVDLAAEAAAYAAQRNAAPEPEPAPKGERTGWFDPPGKEWWTQPTGCPPLPRA